jgi:hypothetical protein
MESGRWADPPNFEQEVLRVGEAFWAGHTTGRYAADLEGALAGVLVRDAEQAGWGAPFRALTPQGELRSLADWFAGQPADIYADPVHRLENLAGPQAGDLLLISNYAGGYYFGGPVSGVHGGLHPEDSFALLAYGWPGVPAGQWEAARTAIEDAIIARCQAEGGRYLSTADMATGLMAVLNP